MRMGHGFTTSRIRKQKKAAANHATVLGRNKQVTHTPTNSSNTARLGSESEEVVKLPVAQIPTKKPIPISAKRPIESSSSGEKAYMRIASRLPTVPGAKGARPEPSPLPISQPNRAIAFRVRSVVETNISPLLLAWAPARRLTRNPTGASLPHPSPNSGRPRAAT